MPPPSVVAVLWEITAPLIMASFAEEASATPPPFSAVFAFAALPPMIAPSSVSDAPEPEAKIPPPLPLSALFEITAKLSSSVNAAPVQMPPPFPVSAELPESVPADKVTLPLAAI